MKSPQIVVRIAEITETEDGDRCDAEYRIYSAIDFGDGSGEFNLHHERLAHPEDDPDEREIAASEKCVALFAERWAARAAAAGMRFSFDVASQAEYQDAFHE